MWMRQRKINFLLGALRRKHFLLPAKAVKKDEQ
jgi:hypothetical protein